MNISMQKSTQKNNCIKTFFLDGDFYLLLVTDKIYRRRPRRPPFLLVLSDGMGVTSSVKKIRTTCRINLNHVTLITIECKLNNIIQEKFQRARWTCNSQTY